MSVINNDLPWRLAELMVQMYNGARVESRKNNNNGVDSRTVVDDSLQLKVRCRMSMSLMFDSIWRWREEFQAQGRGNLEGIDGEGQVPKLMITNCVSQDQEVVFYKGAAKYPPSKSLNRDQDRDMFSYKGKGKDKVPDQMSNFSNPTPMNAFDFSSRADDVADYGPLFEQSFRSFDPMTLLDFSNEETSHIQKQELD
ncbi:hypothetical protein LARI1_G007770 [Lachnellula arida]|uniref:Uncharacterized protein n=1 Tax=Lachnellula arida TaxID=1316785 RepID=A0A8T9B3Z3_9HELO|nr:hypothetical protein LARI1_G007770 [Lachnellula arida]